MVEEAPLRTSKHGLVADVRGWFVVNAREARWRDAGPFGAFCDFEGKKPFLELGINISVLRPGDAMARYHRENAQEDFLVVSGSCVLIVEGEERDLRAWDFFHSPPGTEHVIVAGDEGAVVVAIGARAAAREASSISCPRRPRATARASSARRRSRRTPTPACPRGAA